uniref:Phospholipid phosphatase 3-like isoform X1 n=1 Tax=Petromyzon marinus TaxID=7757 RepID=A0AAJ7X5A9_PETMA|nr:phospholipid phosphatase 3-like isoform X1 [Petromyzon marinus]
MTHLYFLKSSVGRDRKIRAVLFALEYDEQKVGAWEASGTPGTHARVRALQIKIQWPLKQEPFVICRDPKRSTSPGVGEAGASLPFLVLEINVVDPFQRGFFCGDETIDYPYEKSETVSDGLLIAGGFLIALATVIGGELCAACCLGHRCPPVLKRGGSLPGALYRTLGAFLFGCAVNQSLTDVAKFSVGRLRPHFLDVCKPDRALYNCSEGYITRVVCTGDPAVIAEARKSFFSGHASFAMYSMVFLALYVESRLRWRGARILRPLLQFVLLLVAVFVGLSRLSDYRHHWSDVLVGFGSGAAVAFAVVFLISGLFTDNCLAVHKRREAARTNGDLEQGQAANHNGHADAAATAAAAAIRCSAHSGGRQATTPPEPAVSE